MATGAQLIAGYDLLLLELRERIVGLAPGGLPGRLIDLGDELVEGHGWRGSDARRVVAALLFDLREAGRHWLGISDSLIDWESVASGDWERALLQHLIDPHDPSWEAIKPFQIARQQLGRL